MHATLIRFVLGTVALYLILDIMVRLLYAIHTRCTRNRLLDEYTDDVPVVESHYPVHIAVFIISILINLVIYYI